MDEPIFVDTNVFLRFFVRDVESSYQKAKELFEKAEKREIKLVTSDMVIAEIVWVLESYYNLSRTEIKDIVDAILDARNMETANHARVKEAADLYASGRMDFIDAYNIAFVRAKGYAKLATFDIKHFKNIEGLTPIWNNP